MKSLPIALCVALLWIPLPPGGPPAASPPSETAPAPRDTTAKRVHVPMDGFELDPNSGQAGHTVGATRPGGPTVFLSAPNLTKLYSLSPTFYWTSGVKTKAFVFRLYDADGDVGYETRIPEFSLKYPADATPLEPGKTYAWNVLAGLGLLGGGSLPVKFMVLGPEERGALEKQLAGADAVKRAAIFTDNRLWYDAVQAYTELIAEHPDRADFYERRGEIYDQIAATQQLAKADFAKADELRTKK